MQDYNRMQYTTPLVHRYASKEMSSLFSDQSKYSTWRKLWVYLAEAEKECGINITDKQICEMKNAINSIDFERAEEIESETKHDVMAHIKLFGEQCPDAAPIIHLGATSCYVTDNTDLIIMHEAILLIMNKLRRVMRVLAECASDYKCTPTLGYTHLQPAQPTTVGKRFAMWAYDLNTDYQALDYQYLNMQFLGCRGATGTSDSFLKLFEWDVNKVETLEKLLLGKTKFTSVIPVSGQTYSRKVDFYVLQVLSGIAQSASKFATDIRLLASKHEIMESFSNSQVGSSAMPYKQNPILCERICSLARYVICNLQNTAITASTQWLERSLDDSANRRIVIPETFLAVDAILELYEKVVFGLRVDTESITENLNKEKSFTTIESILMYCVNRGGDRQKLHEKLKQYAISAKEKNVERYLPIMIASDSDFGVTEEEVRGIMQLSKFHGMAEEQTDKYIRKLRRKLG